MFERMIAGKKRKTVDVTEVIFKIASVVCLGVLAVACVYPFWYIFIYSVSDPGAAATGVWLWPKGFSLGVYKQILMRDDIVRGYIVTILRTVIGTTITICCTTVLAFLMTRQEMIGRKIVYRFFIITMYVGGGTISWYLTMKAYHLQDSFLLYVIPSAVGVYYMILIKTYIEQIPPSMEESAQIEGAGFFTILFRIIMPLSKPILATCTVYTAVGQWNSWSDNFYLVRDPKWQTIQLILRNYIMSASAIANSIKMGGMVNQEELASAITPTHIQMVVIMIVTIPVLLVYPFAQKYFTKGIMMGAVKG